MQLAKLPIKLPELEVAKYWHECLDSLEPQSAAAILDHWGKQPKEGIVLKRSLFEASNEFREGRELIGNHLPGRAVLQFQRMRIKFGLG